MLVMVQKLKLSSEIIGVHLTTFSPICDDWENLGIIYVVPTPRGKPAGKYYKNIFPLDI